MSEETLRFSTYECEESLPEIMALVQKDLSEPYSVFTYRYFVNRWHQLCEMVHNEADELVGVVVCKIDEHKSGRTRGYIGMLAVDPRYRNKGLASKLVNTVLERMRNLKIDECVLEAEVTNQGALSLYKRLGFLRTKLLHNYYLSGSDAYRLKLYFTPLAPLAM
jgi:peptide alpha-N-acetyltransferase